MRPIEYSNYPSYGDQGNPHWQQPYHHQYHYGFGFPYYHWQHYPHYFWHHFPFWGHGHGYGHGGYWNREDEGYTQIEDTERVIRPFFFFFKPFGFSPFGFFPFFFI